MFRRVETSVVVRVNGMMDAVFSALQRIVETWCSISNKVQMILKSPGSIGWRREGDNDVFAGFAVKS